MEITGVVLRPVAHVHQVATAVQAGRSIPPTVAAATIAGWSWRQVHGTSLLRESLVDRGNNDAQHDQVQEDKDGDYDAYAPAGWYLPNYPHFDSHKTCYVRRP